jgi:hypothetical protein
MRSDQGLVLDWLTADRITVCCLQDAKQTLRNDLSKHKENNSWLHPDDVIYNEAIIEAIDVLLRYYGEL